VISEIPTPYRMPFYELLAARPEIDLEVVFCSRAQPDRPWDLDGSLDRVPHRFLRGVSPAVRTRQGTFVYEVNPGAVPLAARGTHDAVVIGGYAVFAEQAAIAISLARGIPYLLHSESTLAAPRPPLVQRLKSAAVGAAVRGAAAGLATGTEASRYLVHYGMAPDRIRIVPNTVDVAAYRRTADEARARAEHVRAEWGLPERYVLFAGRLVEDKGILDLLAARALLGDSALPLVVAGSGPLERDVQDAPGVVHAGFLRPERLVELFALAEWTVVPSHREPWGVVVNESLASGCPVIVTERVGAAADLVIEGVNGRIVPPRAPAALAAALAGPQPSGDPARGPIENWTHEYAVEQFLQAIELALGV
jgi:glycosyltransferase involved in cell wall biosynthesis